MNFADGFTPKKLQDAWELIKSDFPAATWETLYVTILSTLFAILIGMPLGMLLVVGDKNGIRPCPQPVIKILNVIINLLRSMPFVTLLMAVIPFTRLIVGTAMAGGKASIVPLVIAAFPFITRLVEGSLREVNPSIIEAAQSMGASPMQILFRVMLPESVPSLITNFTLAITTILGYTAMLSVVGGRGVGEIAITKGYGRKNYATMYASIIVLVILVQLFQTVGSYLARKSDKRLKT